MHRRSGFTLIEVMIVVAILAVVIAIAVPGLLTARKNANETTAIGALKTINSAQALFREADRDQDGVPDFGTLAELVTHGYLIDETLAGGTKQGYTFVTAPAAADPTSSHYAVAHPAFYGHTGDRAFCTNAAGVIYYTTATIPLSGPLVTHGVIPADCTAVQ